jgi:hemerythrin HHE cation binding domain-containing protein
MTGPAPRYPGPSGGIRRYVPARDAEASLAADIVELIRADHRRIRRLCSAVYDTARQAGQPGPEWMLGHVWQRLAGLLVAHTQAEEQTCYACVPGARATEWTRDPVADHEDIRKFVGEAARYPVGSAPWWHAVSTVIEASTEHHEREEREILPRYVASLSLSRRKELGRQWCAFMAAWPFDGPGRGREPGHGPEESPAGSRAEG